MAASFLAGGAGQSEDMHPGNMQTDGKVVSEGLLFEFKLRLHVVG